MEGSIANSTDIPNGTIPTPEASLLKQTIFVAFHILFALGFVNFILLALICRGRLTKDAMTNILVGNLAVSGAMLVLSMPFMLTYVHHASWLLGKPMCILYWALEQGNKYSSILFLTALCVDRFALVVWPVSAPQFRVRRLAWVVSLSIWAFVPIIIIPVFLYTTTIDIKTRDGTIQTMCIPFWPRRMGTWWQPEIYYNIATFTLLFSLPLILNVGLYTKVVCVLKQLEQSTTSVRGRSRRYRHTTIIILSVMAWYIICWVPFWCKNVLHSLEIHGNMAFSYIAHALPYLNATVNPLLLMLASPDVEKCVKFCGRRLKRIGPVRLGRAPPGGHQACVHHRSTLKLVHSALDVFVSMNQYDTVRNHETVL